MIVAMGVRLAAHLSFVSGGWGDGVSRGLMRPLAGLVMMLVPTQLSLAQTRSSVGPDGDAAISLPAIAVDSPKQPSKRRQPRDRNPRNAARPAQQPPPSDPAGGPPAAVSGTPNVGSGPASQPNMASQLSITGEALNARPIARPGEILEAVPGLIVTQHSGEGKANQYFLRGYNLDHGTDLAIWVDDVPINMRTHAHGQGYSDLNWLMPETINRLDIRKGPYFADEGDFGSAGNLHIGLIDRTDKSIAQVTVGSFGYRRLFGMGSTKVGEGTLLVAGEAGTYNGPWDNPDDMRKLNSLVRYTQGTALDGFSITGMAYANRWNSTDQVPQRAISSGQLGLYGAEDPSDGGKTNRFALSARGAGVDDAGSWKVNAFAVKSGLDLFNNFTYFLANPVLGDQFHQHDDRVMAGANASRTLSGSLADRPMETTFGIQTRYDAINLALSDTYRRTLLSNVRSDKVGEASVGVYAQNSVRWTDWLRTTVGWRGDYYDATVTSLFDPNNSGGRTRRSAIRNFPWWPALSTRPSCSLPRAWACTATTRAAPQPRKTRVIPLQDCPRRLCWCGPGAPKWGSEASLFPDSTPQSACSCSIRPRRSSSTAMPAIPRKAGRADALVWNGPTFIGQRRGLNSTRIWR